VANLSELLDEAQPCLEGILRLSCPTGKHIFRAVSLGQEGSKWCGALAPESWLIKGTSDAPPILMSKMPHAGENHRHAMLVGRSDHFFILDRAARLDDRLGPRFCRRIDAVTERAT